MAHNAPEAGSTPAAQVSLKSNRAAADQMPEAPLSSFRSGRGQAARVEWPWQALSRRFRLNLVHSPRKSALFAIALAIGAFALPAVAEAAKVPEKTEGVTVVRYLMGRVQPSIRARGAAHLWTNTGFSNRRAVYPVLRHRTMAKGSEWLQVKVIKGRRNVKVWIPRWATRRVWLHYLVQRRHLLAHGEDLPRRPDREALPRRRRRARHADAAPATSSSSTGCICTRAGRTAAGRIATSAFSHVLTDFAGGSGEIALHTRGSLGDPVGTARSHGCVRFNNGDINWVAAHVPNGTPLWVEA